LVFGLYTGTGFAQQDNQNPVSSSRSSSTDIPRATDRSSSNILVEPSEDYRIGSRDVIEISIADAPELSGIFAVSSKGTIPMAFLNTIEVRGKTIYEVADMIAGGLRGRYLKNPRVSVTVREYNSRSFFVMGAVSRPGVYLIESHASLHTLLILAGGLSATHGSTAFIFRKLKPEATNALAQQTSTQADPPPSEGGKPAVPEYEWFQVNINNFLKGEIKNNFDLEAGDVVNIPAADVFFVAGEVEAPGDFILKPGTTLRQALGLARGFKSVAAKDRGFIVREDPVSGKREEIKVDLGAVMDGKKPDVPLMANDMIIVPHSKAKAFGGALLNAFGVGVAQRGVPIR
jgi:polysaccharide export outer membrane protein